MSGPRTIHLLGFEVVVAPAWLGGAALLLVSFVAMLPVADGPRLIGAPALVIAAAVAVLLALTHVLLSVARAAVARARGEAPGEVRVFLLGQPPRPETPPTSPSNEFVVALVVPLTAGLAGAAALILGRVLATATSQPLSAIAWGIGWWAAGALVIAGLACVPVLPLDGGRMVRAVAWRVTGDLGRATRICAAFGRAFGYVVVGGGLVALLAGEALVGVWLLLLGWLATRVSRASAERARLDALTAGLLVRDAIDPAPATISPGITLDALLAQDDRGGEPGVYPVVAGGQLVGVVFAARVGRRERARASDLRASDVMVPLERLPHLGRLDRLLDAVIALERMRVAGLPVVDDEVGGLAGLVTRERVLERLRARQALQAARSGETGRANG